MFESMKKYRPKEMNELTDLRSIAAEIFCEMMPDTLSSWMLWTPEDIDIEIMCKIARAFRVHLSEIEMDDNKPYTLQGKPMSEIKLTPACFEKMHDTCPDSLDKQIVKELIELERKNENSKTS